MKKTKGPRSPTPPALTEVQKKNYNTLKRAARDGRLALLSAVRKADGRAVALLCAINCDIRPRGDKGCMNYYPVPLAELIDGNPFELYHDPTE